jgi:hypothetical protein
MSVYYLIMLSNACNKAYWWLKAENLAISHNNNNIFCLSKILSSWSQIMKRFLRC